MHITLTTLIDRLDSPAAAASGVIKWGSPVLSFGDPSRSRVATVGLNPSNREFVDDSGDELAGMLRRFHTLNSLGIESWMEADARHLQLILDSYVEYFARNPYERWFKKLDPVVSAAGASFYGACATACHLDLIPYATGHKWTELSGRQRSLLLEMSADSLGLLLRDSDIAILILNGQSVVDNFQRICGVCMERKEMIGWSLTRRGNAKVPGIAYKAVVDKVAQFQLPRRIAVLGYNHNIQSSFGVTTGVVQSISSWIRETVAEEAS